MNIFIIVIDDDYNNIDDYNISRKRKILTVFDDMIADIMTLLIFLFQKKLN